jgi:hypothetical protein
LKEKVKAYSVKAVMFKAAASICFVGVAAVSLFAKGYHALSIFVTLGLFFGVLGDIWLDFKYVFKEHDKIFTYAGFIMFALGHACYISGMYLEFFNGQSPLYIILPLVGGLLISICNLFIAKPMKLDYSGYKVISIIYGFFLFSMTLSALSLSIMMGFNNVTLIMMFAGGLLFTISDLILSGTYFGKGKERPVDIITNSVTYYAAQFVIALALFFI